MRCSDPLLALRLYKPSLGKQSIKILPKRVDMNFENLYSRYGKENILKLPCGRCPACLARRAKEWSVRCCLEALDHKQNCFVTLTYEKEAIDENQVRDDMHRFIKSLRNRDIKVRYFGCCERGDQYGRLHAHIILFGFFPDDFKPWAKSKKGFMQYTSKIVSDCWKQGLAVVAEFHPFAAHYVAGYAVKKFATSDSSFHIQSTKPGIGAGYLLRNIQDIYDADKLVLNFGSHQFSVPRYFDKLAEQLDLDLSDIKASRLEKAELMFMKDLHDRGFTSVDQLLVFNGDLASKQRYQKRSF